MTLTTHALIGAAAASLLPGAPAEAFAAGIASHFLIDAIPHWDYSLRSAVPYPDEALEVDLRWGADFFVDMRSIAVDALLGLCLVLLTANTLGAPVWLALIGAGAGVYPDLLTFAYMKARRFAPLLGWAYRPLQRFHDLVNWKEWKGWEGAARGIALQALLVAAAFVLVSLT